MGVQAEGYSSAVWRKSNYSGDGANCIEIALTGEDVLVRDSRDRHGPTLTLSISRWRDFLREVRSSP